MTTTNLTMTRRSTRLLPLAYGICSTLQLVFLSAKLRHERQRQKWRIRP